MVSKRVLFLAAAVLMLALASGLPVEQEEGERRQLHDDSCHLGLPACYVYTQSIKGLMFSRTWIYSNVLCPVWGMCPIWLRP